MIEAKAKSLPFPFHHLILLRCFHFRPFSALIFRNIRCPQHRLAQFALVECMRQKSNTIWQSKSAAICCSLDAVSLLSRYSDEYVGGWEQVSPYVNDLFFWSSQSRSIPSQATSQLFSVASLPRHNVRNGSLAFSLAFPCSSIATWPLRMLILYTVLLSTVENLCKSTTVACDGDGSWETISFVH